MYTACYGCQTVVDEFEIYMLLTAPTGQNHYPFSAICTKCATTKTLHQCFKDRATNQHKANDAAAEAFRRNYPDKCGVPPQCTS
jgi:hypothetical protein